MAQIGQVAYAAAKASIAGMMPTMARDLGTLGIRVLAITPGLFSTGITKGIPDEVAEPSSRMLRFPSGRATRGVRPGWQSPSWKIPC